MPIGEALPYIQTVMQSGFVLFLVVWLTRLGTRVGVLCERLNRSDPAALAERIDETNRRMDRLEDKMSLQPEAWNRPHTTLSR